jgi:hypothetical protein
MSGGRILHFTIGTGPGQDDSSSHLSLMNDLRLLKAALLYADRVRLCSIGSSLTLQMLALGEAETEQKLEWLELFFADLSRADTERAATVLQLIRTYRELRQRRNLRRLSKPELGTMFQIQAALARMWDEYAESIWEFARKAGADGIIDALESGLVDIHQFAAGGPEHMGGLHPGESHRRSEDLFEALTFEFFELVAEAVAGGSTYPLFDEMAGKLVRAGIEEGSIAPTGAGLARGRHSGLASDLVGRLPLFEKASVREILDIRRSLEGPLIRFRGAVIEFSEDIRFAAWDEEFASEADMVFRRKVAPAVEDLREAVEQNSSLTELMLRAGRPKDVMLGLGAAGGMSAFSEVAAVALAGSLTAASIGRSAYKEWREKQQEIEGNKLFFYYRAGERIRELSGDV